MPSVHPDFKGGDIKVKSVNIANCTASPCVIKRGDNNTAIIQIESSELPTAAAHIAPPCTDSCTQLHVLKISFNASWVFHMISATGWYIALALCQYCAVLAAAPPYSPTTYIACITTTVLSMSSVSSFNIDIVPTWTSLYCPASVRSALDLFIISTLPVLVSDVLLAAVKLTNVTNKIYGVVRNTKILFKTLDGCTYGLDCPVPANTARTETVTLPTVGYPPVSQTVCKGQPFTFNSLLASDNIAMALP